MDPKDKVAMVTGGVSGIGFSIATELLKNGVKGVALLDINQETGEKALKTLEKEYGKKVIFIKCDVTNFDEFENSFKETKTKFGDVNILVNNAGTGDSSDYVKLTGINLCGVMHGIMLGQKYLNKNETGSGGVIVNTASAVVFFQINYIIPNYTATKAGVILLSQTWGHTYHYNRTGVRVIAICPGWVDTPILQKPTKPHEELNESEREYVKIIEQTTLMKPDVVGRSAIYVIKNADSGSVWMIDENRLSKVNYPPHETMMELVMDQI